jgi:hypothetical protein
MNRFSLPSVSRYYARRKAVRAGRRRAAPGRAEPPDAEEGRPPGGQDDGDRD